MITAFLGLGSNVGDRLENLRAAVSHLNKHLKITRTSYIYETEPVGFKDQPWFYNAVAKTITDLSVYELFEVCKKIEQDMQRKETVRWGPRIIDIDILLFGSSVIHEERLQVPHPEMQNRAFVMLPLCEIEPELELPDGGNVCSIAHETRFEEQVIKTDKKPG